MNPSTATHVMFVIVRNFNSPVQNVFRAWADPDGKARWFASSAEALGNGYELDFQVGGREINRGGPPGGPAYTYTARFQDIVVDQRIVFSYEMLLNDFRIWVTAATVEFHQSEGATELVLTEQGVFLDGLATAANHQEGSQSPLDALAISLDGDVP